MILVGIPWCHCIPSCDENLLQVKEKKVFESTRKYANIQSSWSKDKWYLEVNGIQIGGLIEIRAYATLISRKFQI